MTVVAPLEWDRAEIDAATGESIATCNSKLFGAFIWPLAFFMLIPTVLTGIMAWKTQDVDASFSDAFWVGVLIVVQIEVRSKNWTFLRVAAKSNCDSALLFRLSYWVSRLLTYFEM